MTVTLAALVPLLPLLAAACLFAAGHRAPGLVRPLAVLPTLAAAALAVATACDLGSGRHLDAATRLASTGGTPIDLSFHLDGIAVLLGVLVTVVSTCVQAYSTAYLREDPRYPSYAALVSLFTAAMLLVVYSGDLIVLLVGWEVMGVCSYFLIGHHWETGEARSASLKAFLVTKLGDVPFLFGIFVLAGDAGTFRVSGVLDAAAHGRLHHATLAALLLLCGVAGKSAQFPLHTWLPDAMAGPTPVSALIHAATMVAAGVYLVARLLPVFLLSTAALTVLGVLAAVTMVGSGICALAQDDIKRVLAYSTVGQLGYMTGALAVGDRDAALFHLLTHGAFKALLFLAAGSVIHAAHTNSLSAMSRMEGLRRRVPDAYWTMTIGLLALAGIPPFSGFFSKESVLGAARHAADGHADTHGLGPASAVPGALGWLVLVAAAVTALLTAAYATRLWLLAFHGPSVRPAIPLPGTAPGEDPAKAPREPGEAVTNTVLWLLALPALALGVVGLHRSWLPAWLDGADLTPSWDTAVIGVGAAVVGCLLAVAAWRAAVHRVTAATRADRPADALAEAAAAVIPHSAESRPEETPADLATAPGVLGTRGAPAETADRLAVATVATLADAEALVPTPSPTRLLLGPLTGPAARGFDVDRLYRAAVVLPTVAAARLVRFLDANVVETYVRGAANGTGLLGRLARRTQNGNPQTYLSALLAAATVLAVLVAVVR